MGIENYSAADVLVGAADLLYAPLNTALPDETSVVVDSFASWPAGWIHLGYTNGPPAFNYTEETFEVEAEQATAPVAEGVTRATATITTALLQFEGDHLALVTGGTNTVTAAAAGQKGFERVVAGGRTTLARYMFALEGQRADAAGNLQPVRLFLYKATIRANGDIAFAKAAGTSIPIVINAQEDASKPAGARVFEAHIVTAPAS